MSMKKVAIIFGGCSSEHEVSCKSAINVITSIDKNTYELFYIGITKEGKWLKVDTIDEIKDGTWVHSKVTALISPDREHHGLLFIDGGQVTVQRIDVVFPVLHGKNGEDGTIQGLFEMSGIPYVGCGVLCSAVSMDKISTKIFVDRLGIRQAKYVAMIREGEQEIPSIIERVEKELSYPVFVKPSNAGSSKGVSKATNAEELKESILLARQHDKRVLIEEMIVGREIECAVLGSKEADATVPGEIVAAAEFYDYDAKYNNEESKTVVNPPLPEGVAEQIQEAAKKIFSAVNGFGLSRVDFFVENDTNEVVFNEINTLPGFTNISMYPMLWEAMGLKPDILLSKLIQMAEERMK